jgi:hypothetical protein
MLILGTLRVGVPDKLRVLIIIKNDWSPVSNKLHAPNASLSSQMVALLNSTFRQQVKLR